MPDGPKPKYKWRVTWPDDPETHKTDFCGWDGDIGIGRIRFEPHGLKRDTWQWSGHGPKKLRRHTPHQGYEPTARKAAAKVEEYYHQMLANNGMPKA
ncbi:hypothetical protein [Pararhizobium sp.]|uniref:hypothetical protein n=1 Tax=Pararhizobium sp. TaxID=1977563 RepID=UPI002726BF90|nr:hypothetical protein [Pararhizobium sp.]MDO9417054.1 hypothetical protein [Pararhizobium sp.]